MGREGGRAGRTIQLNRKPAVGHSNGENRGTGK